MVAAHAGRTLAAMALCLAAALPSYAASASASALASAPASASPAPALTPCRVDGIRHAVQCGQVSRALDPARPGGPHMQVHYVVVPALARNKLPDPVFLLAGGPGQSAIEVAGQVMPVFSRLNNRRDIVFVDQRGTGRSAPLRCDDTGTQPLADQTDPARQLARLRECRERLARLPHGDLRHYTTPIAMQDLDAVRRALGAERINLVGVSYGTRAALEYLRQFPQAVRRLVLDGVAPPDMALPASYSTDGQAAYDALFANCAADAACAQRYPRLKADWSAWLARLPQPVEVPHPLTGAPERFMLTRAMALAAVRAALYSPILARALPEALHQASQGRAQGLLTLGSQLTGRRGGVAVGLHFSVVCSEDLARLAHVPDTPGADFGDEAVRLYEQACADWPRGSLPAGYYTLNPSPTPALLLSGGLDPATPPRHGERVARALGPQARHVVVPQAGHGVMSLGCMPELMHRFLDEPDPAVALALDMQCVQGIPRAPVFVPLGTPGSP